MILTISLVNVLSQLINFYVGCSRPHYLQSDGRIQLIFDSMSF